MKNNEELIKVGDVIHFTLKQEKPFFGCGKVIKIWENTKAKFEIDVYPYSIFPDEITKVCLS